MVEEVRTRFQRMNIPEKCLNSKVKLRDNNPDAILILKCCIGGAFYNKFVKATYKNDSILAKALNSHVEENEEDRRSIILNKLSPHIHEGHLKQFFEAKFKVPVEKILLH
jgi:hypothetical protein